MASESDDWKTPEFRQKFIDTMYLQDFNRRIVVCNLYNPCFLQLQ